MINRTRFIKIMSIILLLSSLIFAPKVSAEMETYGAFYVEANLPENQFDKNVGYFDLKLEENVEQTISFDIINDGDETMTSTITFNNGTTGMNAEKSYQNDVTADSSMMISMIDMVTLEKNKVVVPPHSVERVYLKIKTPKTAFSGVSVGGIIVTSDYDNKEAVDNKQDIELNNRISYLVAIQIRMTDDEVKKNLNYVRSTAELYNNKPNFFSTIQNDQAIVMNDVTVEGVVLNQEQETVAQINKASGGILPNTEFKVAYELVDEKIEAGDYDITLKITSGDDEWSWTEKVTVEEQEAKEINEQIPVKRNANLLMYLIIALLLILIVLVLFLILKNRNNKE